MPLQTFDFLNARTNVPEYDAIGKTLSNFLEGYKISKAPAKMAEEQRKAELANALSQLELQYKPEDYKTQFDLRRAQAQHQRASAQTGGLPTGSIGNAMKLYMLEQKLGSDHPAVVQMKQIQELEQKREQGILDWQKANMAALPTRLLTQEGKTLKELDDIKRGYKLGSSTTGGEPELLSPEDQNYQRAQYEMKLLSDITDPAQRDRMRAAADVHTTLATIDPDTAFKYSGIGGTISKALKQGKSALTGKEAEDYAAFEENMTSMKLASKQLSRFFGAGAAEGIQKDIQDIANPNSWAHSPDVSRKKFERLVKLFEMEADNMRQAIRNPNFYGGRSPDVGGFQQQGDPGFSKVIQDAGQQEASNLFGKLMLEDDGSP